MKRKIYYLAQKYLTGEKIKSALLLVFIVAFLVLGKITMEYNWMELLDLGVLVSFAIVFLCDCIARLILDRVEKVCEDEAKLSVDYAALVKKYSADDLITAIDDENVAFPVIKLCDVYDGMIEIRDEPQKFYDLPKGVAAESEKIMRLTNHSVVYNQINIRLNSLETNTNGIVTLHTGRTYYFDSLITNRASDYQMKSGKTIRDMYEPGPYIRSLEDSKFSNHLGFNGFVITKDGKIPFIYRSNDVSIGKGTWANSIGASLKTKYAVEKKSQHYFTLKGLGNSILREIEDELGVNCSGISEQESVKSVIAFYRDLVEAGKPQFLFFMELPVTSEELEAAFTEKANKKKSGESKVIQDGKIIEFFTVDELKSAKITPGKFVVRKDKSEKEYKIMPSASACIVMLIERLIADEKKLTDAGECNVDNADIEPKSEALCLRK